MTVDPNAPLDPAAPAPPEGGQPDQPAPAVDPNELLRRLDEQSRVIQTLTEQNSQILQSFQGAQQPAAGAQVQNGPGNPPTNPARSRELLSELVQSPDANPYLKAMAEVTLQAAQGVEQSAEQQRMNASLARVPADYHAKAQAFQSKYPDRVGDYEAAYYAILGIEAAQGQRPPSPTPPTSDARREAQRAAAAAAPTLPSGHTPPANDGGEKPVTIDEFEQKYASDPVFRQKFDAGLIDVVGI